MEFIEKAWTQIDEDLMISMQKQISILQYDINPHLNPHTEVRVTLR